jgi:hypothetical protein
MVQCNLDLVTVLVSAKTVTKSHNVSKLKNGLYKIVTKSQVVTNFDVNKSRLHYILGIGFSWISGN